MHFTERILIVSYTELITSVDLTVSVMKTKRVKYNISITASDTDFCFKANVFSFICRHSLELRAPNYTLADVVNIKISFPHCFVSTTNPTIVKASWTFKHSMSRFASTITIRPFLLLSSS